MITASEPNELLERGSPRTDALAGGKTAWWIAVRSPAALRGAVVPGCG
jgi:hypothetical protein